MATRGLGTLTLDLILRTGGFTQGADKAAREVQRLAEGLKRFKVEGERLAASVATPFETFTKSIKLYNEALKGAHIEQETFNRLIQQPTAGLQASAGAMQAHNAALEAFAAGIARVNAAQKAGSISVDDYDRQVAELTTGLNTANTALQANAKAFEAAQKLAASAITPLEQYLADIRAIGAAKIAAPELITRPIQQRLETRARETFAGADPATQKRAAQQQELDRILQGNITTLERYEAELRVVNDAQKRGVGDAAELAKAATRLQAAIDAETPALQKQKAAMEAAKATAASMVPPLEAVAARMAEIRAQAKAFPTIVTPQIETAALEEQQKRIEDLNGVTEANNRLEAEAKRIKQANIPAQQAYNDTLALNAELVRLNKISQAEANAENAKAKAILDSQDAALKEHNALMAEGAALTKSVMSAQERYDAEVARANKLLATYDATLKRTAISETDHARALKQARANLDAANGGLQQQRKSFFALRNDLLGINGLLIRFTSIYALVGAVRGVIKIVDDYKLLENRLQTVTQSTAELKRVQDDLFEVAQRTRQAYAGVVDLYVRLAQAGKELGASQSQLLKFTEAVGNAFAISGTTSERARAALVQLSQGLATGTFRAEEFNSVNEASPALIRAVAQNLDRFKGSVGALRNAVREGTLTSKEFFEGTLKASAQLAATVASMPLTISQAFQQLKNTFEKVVSSADMGPLVKAIQQFTTLIKDKQFQQDLAYMVKLLLELSAAGLEIGATFARVFEEMADNARSTKRDLAEGDFFGTKDTVADLEVLQKRYQQTLADIERHPVLMFTFNKEQILKDLQDVSDELAVLRNQMGTAFAQGSAFTERGRYVRGARTKNLPVDEKASKEAEAAQKSILGLIDSMKQQMAVTGETEEATIRYRIAFGDLRDEFAKAGPAFAKYKDELIKTARALDQFKARQDIKKQTEALRAEVVELQAARIEEEQGAVAALKFRREHNVEMAKTIALARGEVSALDDTVAAVKAIPPVKLQVDTTQAKAAIKQVADLPRPTLKVDTAPAEASLKKVAEFDPWAAMQKSATLKVETEQAEADVETLLDKVGALMAPKKVKVDVDLTPAELQAKKVAAAQYDAFLKTKAQSAEYLALVKAQDAATLETARTVAAASSQTVAHVAAVKQEVAKPVAIKVDTAQAVAATNELTAATQRYIDEARLLAQVLDTVEKTRLTAVNTVAAQIKSITDETSAFFQNKIAMEEGAVAALNYRIAHGDLQKTFAQVGGAEYLAVIKDLKAELAASTGNQKALTEAINNAEQAYAKAQTAAANLADQLRIVTEYQEKLTKQEADLEAAFQYVPNVAKAAEDYASAIRGLTALLKAGTITQKQFNDAVKRADKAYEEATQSLDELSVFAEQAAKNMQDAFADFLYDPFSEGLEGMVKGVGDMLRKMSAQIIAAKLFEKFGVEQLLKSGSLTSGPLMEWLKGKMGFGEKAPELQPITVHAERMPETTTQTIAELQKALAVPSTALQTSATSLTTAATTLQTGATTLQTAAQALLTASKTMPGVVKEVAAATTVGGELEPIVITAKRAPEVAAAGGGVPAGASGFMPDPAEEAARTKELAADVFSIAAGLIDPHLAPLIDLVQLLKVSFGGGVEGGLGGIKNFFGGEPAGALEEIAVTAERMPEAAGLTTAATTLTTGATTLTAGATTLTTGATALTTVASTLGAAASALGAAAATMGASSAAGGLEEIIITTARMAEGGRIHGPGTGTSDSIPAWLSAGEFVVKAAAVRQPGVEALLRKINAGTPAVRGAANWPHYATGGLVSPRFATGGVALPEMATVNSQTARSTVVNQTLVVNAQTGNISRATELQITAAAARGARVADSRNN